MSSASTGRDVPVSDAVVALLAQLVAFPTVSRSSNRSLQHWLADQLESLGATVDIVDATSEPGRASGAANLVATIGPNRPGGLLFAAHTDVVDAGTGWATDPWALTVVGDSLYGRGAADMKGFIAALLVALGNVDVASLTQPIRMVASYDEEVGCQGVRDVLPQLAADSAVEPELVVIGEPTSMRPRHAHLGKRVYRLDVRAAEAHSSRSATEPSAITIAAHLVVQLAELNDRCPPTSADGAPPYSVNCGTIHGGTALNVIAGRCEVMFEIRHDADTDPDTLLAPVVAEVQRLDMLLTPFGGGVTCQLINHYPPMATDPSAPRFAHAVRVADTGPSLAVGFGTEGGLFAEVTNAPIMICGPGDIANAHRPDEFVTLHELERCVRFVQQLIRDVCLAAPNFPA